MSKLSYTTAFGKGIWIRRCEYDRPPYIIPDFHTCDAESPLSNNSLKYLYFR